MRKILTLLLSAAMVICMMPGMAFAESEVPIEITADSHILNSGKYILNQDIELTTQNSYSGKDQPLSGQLEIPEDANVVVDLNGYVLTSNYEGISILNKGTLTINDSSEAKSGRIYNNNAGAISWYGHDVIRNLGELTINGGTFGDKDLDRGNPNENTTTGAAIRNIGTAVINGGYFTCTDNYPTNGGWSYAIRSSGTMTIKGGTVYGAMNGGIAADSGSIHISDVNVKITGTASYACLASSVDNGGQFYVSGGTFEKKGNQHPILNGFSGMPSWDATEDLTANGYTLTGGTFIVEGKEINLVPVAQVGEKVFPTLQAAVNAAQDGDTIELLQNVDVTGYPSDDRYGLGIENKSITIDGNGLYTINAGAAGSRGIYIKGGNSVEETKNIVFKDVKIINSKDIGRCIDTRGGYFEIVLDNTELRCTGSGNVQTLTIGGNHSDKQMNKVYISNGSYIEASDDGYSIVTFNPVSLMIEKSTLSGWANLYFKGIDSSAGTAGSEISIVDSNLNSINNHSGDGNDFGAIVFEDNNISVTLRDTEINVTSVSPNKEQRAVFFSEIYKDGKPTAVAEGNIVSMQSGTNVNLKGDMSQLVNSVEHNQFVITGGTYSVDPSGYVTDGYVVSQNADNTWTVSKYYPPSIPSIPPTVDDPITNTGGSSADNGTTNVDISKDSASSTETTPVTNPDGTTSTTTTTTIAQETADKIVEKAVENKSAEVILDVTAGTVTTAPKAGDKAEVKLPVSILQNLSEKTTADVTVKSDVAEVKLDEKAMAAVAEKTAGQPDGTTVTLIVESTKNDKTEMRFELMLTAENGAVHDFNGGTVSVTVKLNDTLKSEPSLACVYIADTGKVSKVTGEKKTDGTFTFVTGHFSTYAVMTAAEADKLVEEQTDEYHAYLKNGVKNTTIKLNSSLAKKGIKLKWTKSKGFKVDCYQVYRGTKKDGKYTKIYTTKSGKATSITNVKNVKKGRRYYYKVRGVREIGGETVYTKWSTKAWRTFR